MTCASHSSSGLRTQRPLVAEPHSSMQSSYSGKRPPPPPPLPTPTQFALYRDMQTSKPTTGQLPTAHCWQSTMHCPVLNGETAVHVGDSRGVEGGWGGAGLNTRNCVTSFSACVKDFVSASVQVSNPVWKRRRHVFLETQIN